MTSQTYAESLISESVSTTSIVHVGPGDAYAAGCEWDALLGALLLKCEDDAENGSIREFWGTTESGDVWRVYARVR